MHNEILKIILRVLPFAVVIIAITILIRKGKINPVDIGLQKPLQPGRSFLWCLFFLAFVLLIEFMLFKKGLLEIAKWNKPLIPSIIQIFGTVVLAPVAEELLFRGLLLFKCIKRGMNKHLAIVLVSVFFVALHNFTYQNTLSSHIGIVQSFTDAILFSYARFHTKSLFTSMAMHSIGNTVAVVERFLF